jgi:tetratricopeptide (TPR) repeat protein
MQRRGYRRRFWLLRAHLQLSAFLKGARRKITFQRLVVLVFVLPVLFYVYREMTRDVLIIDPFTVPKRFEEAGLTSEVMANRIGDTLRQIELATQTYMKKDNLTSLPDEASTPDVEIPGTKLGLKTFVDITRSVFGIYPKHISGDIVFPVTVPSNADLPFAKNQATVTIYVTQGRTRNPAVSIVVGGDDVGMLVQRTAETILGQVNPYVFAVYHYDHHEYGKAIEIAQEIIQNLSEDRLHKTAAFNLLGCVLRDEEKYDDAITNYRKAIDLDPNFAHAYYNLGNVLQDEEKYDDAIVNYRKAIDLDLKFAFAYNNLANALEDQKKYEDAIVNYRKAIDLNPKFALAYNNLGSVLRDERKYEDAIVNYRKAIDLDPNFALAYNCLGIVLEDQKKYEDAIVNYRKAIDLDPNFALAYNGLGNALQDEGKYEDAIVNYRKAIDLDPNFTLAYSGLGNALQHQGRYDDGKEKFAKASELSHP